MSIEGIIQTACMIVGGTILGLFTAIMALVLIGTVVFCVSDTIDKVKNRKNGNLHVKVDTSKWNKRK